MKKIDMTKLDLTKIDFKKIDFAKMPKEVLVAAGASILLVVIFVTFISAPSGRRIRKMKKEAAAAAGQIEEIRKSMAGAASVEEALASISDDISAVEDLFPRKEEAILSELSNQATAMKMEVVSITPRKKGVITNIDGVPVNVKGSFVKEMPVTMSLKGRYRDIGDFIIKLRTDFPMLIKIDSVEMSSSGSEEGILGISLQLNSYMLSDTAE